MGAPVHTFVCDTVVRMQVDRLSVALDPHLGQAVREAAARSGISVSGWMSHAATDRLRNQLLGAALDVWESEDGAFTDEELDAASRALAGKRTTQRRAG